MSDNEILAEVKAVAEAEKGPGRRRLYRCLESRELAYALRRSGPEWPHAELYTYTADDLEAMRLLGCFPGATTRLDRTPITADSRQRVHFVLFGAGSAAESLAIHAALVAHYPNSVRDHTLRTRITLISDRMEDFRPFRQQYQNLLEHCWCREVRMAGEKPECQVEAPRYAGFRQDFTDIEWEFVEADITAPALRYKLEQWATDTEHRQLTLAFCYGEDARNRDAALALPAALGDTPVWIRSEGDAAGIDILRQSGHAHFRAFGPTGETPPDFAVPGLYVHYAYTSMREEGGALVNPCEPPTLETLEALWSGLTTPKRWSSIYSAFTVPTKLRSVGIPEERWDSLFALDTRDVALLSEVEHNRWCIEELILGYIPPTESELAALREDPALRASLKERRHHPDLVAFSELGADETGQSVVRYDEAMIRFLPLLAYSYRSLNPSTHA